jgi:hypothetical protein
MLVRMEPTFHESPEARNYGYWMLAKTAEAGKREEERGRSRRDAERRREESFGVLER